MHRNCYIIRKICERLRDLKLYSWCTCFLKLCHEYHMNAGDWAFMFMYFRQYRRGHRSRMTFQVELSLKSQKALFNLSLCLLFANVLFISGITQVANETGCAIVAASLQFFLLASFSWMLVEALLQYVAIVRVFPISVTKLMWKLGITAWGRWRNLSWMLQVKKYCHNLISYHLLDPLN